MIHQIGGGNEKDHLLLLFSFLILLNDYKRGCNVCSGIQAYKSCSIIGSREKSMICMSLVVCRFYQVTS